MESSPAIGSDGTVYVGSVKQISMPSMARQGPSYGNLKRGVTSSPAIGSDGTVPSGHGTKLYAINGKTGDKLWEFKTGCCVSDDTVYVGSYDKKLYAINARLGSHGNLKREIMCHAKTGVKLWEFETGVLALPRHRL